ncbi:MAG: hypothetical protein BHW49_08485 [Roseburia sp. CAG:18_43_25]|nr:MAG: hypothetical protein BHW49_08485 [Roseburia sp. CAG:18_43_25]
MSADDFCINKLVPGYFSRIKEDGSYSNGSGCGNDTASERNMVRKYIVDSVCYWADVFEYYKGLIKFRKAHPALRLSTSEDVKKYVKSIEGLGDNIVGINIKGGQKDESAKEMYLLFNANTDNAKVTIPEGKCQGWRVYNGWYQCTCTCKTGWCGHDDCYCSDCSSGSCCGRSCYCCNEKEKNK